MPQSAISSKAVFEKQWISYSRSCDANIYVQLVFLLFPSMYVCDTYLTLFQNIILKMQKAWNFESIMIYPPLLLALSWIQCNRKIWLAEVIRCNVAKYIRNAHKMHFLHIRENFEKREYTLYTWFKSSVYLSLYRIILRIVLNVERMQNILFIFPFLRQNVAL